jgi:hypothetical protein
MSNDPQSETMKQIVNWGGQTIAFAMSLHAMSKGKSLDDPTRAQAANAEALKIREELWAAADAECAQPVQLPDMTMRFARKVLDWASEHRKDDPV